MLSDVKPAGRSETVDEAVAGQQSASGSAERPDPPVWALGSRIASRNVELGRKAYLRYAETAELGLNALDSAGLRAGDTLRAMADGPRDVLLQACKRSFAATREMRDRLGALDRQRRDALAAQTARRRLDLRAVALRGQIAADTYVRACFDCAEELAQASSLQDCAKVQASFLVDQWQRSLRQVLDLQRTTAGLLWRAAAAQAT